MAKNKYKTLRFEFRASPLLKTILQKEAKEQNKTGAQIIKDALSGQILRASRIFHLYTDQEREYLSNSFKDTN